MSEDSGSSNSSKVRRYGLVAAGILATTAGISSQIGSVLNLFERFFGHRDASVEAVADVPVAGSWQAEITYDWGLKRTEQFDLKVDGNEVSGTISFLGVKRAIREGKISGDTLTLVTETSETAGDSDPKMTRHQYKGKASPSEIRFELLTTGGFSEHVPVEFVAKKVP